MTQLAIYLCINSKNLKKEFILHPFTKICLIKLLKEVQIKNALFQSNTQEKLQNCKGISYIHQIKSSQIKSLLIIVIAWVSHASQLTS